MRDWYFYQEKGQTIGPLTGDDLRARIRDGRVRLFDMIFKEGEHGWRMALEHPELRDEFKKSADGMKDKPWVCLKRKSPESFDFLTLGPFNTDEVRTQLNSGKISYNDYIWQNGFAEWTRIGNVTDFNPRAKSEAPTVMVPIAPDVEPPDVPEAAAQLLKNVVEFKRGQTGTSVSPKPKEADGEDLTKIVKGMPVAATPARPTEFDPDATRVVNPHRAHASGPPPPPPRTSFKGEELPEATFNGPAPVSPPPASAGAVRPSTEALEPRPKRRRRRSRRPAAIWTDWGIVASLVVGLVVMVGFLVHRLRAPAQIPLPPPVMQNFENQQATSGQLSPPPTGALSDQNTQFGPETLPPLDAAAPPPPHASSDNAKPPPVEPDPAARPAAREPTLLSLSVQGGGSTQARIEVRSNGTAEYPVSLQIVGLPGQVSEGASYYRYVHLKATGNASRPLEMPALKLPQGRFVVHAETGTLHKDAILNLGTGETSYKQAVARGRKLQAQAIWKERLTLYRLSLAVENAVAQAVSSHHLSLRGLDPVMGVRKTNGGKYIFYEEWSDLKQILLDARDKATPAQLDRAKHLRDRIATYSVWRK